MGNTVICQRMGCRGNEIRRPAAFRVSTLWEGSRTVKHEDLCGEHAARSREKASKGDAVWQRAEVIA